jgi:hypothetical protein
MALFVYAVLDYWVFVMGVTVGPKAGLDILEKRTISFPMWNSNPITAS